MKSSHNGFTLIEVLVAMVIFSINVLAVTSLMVNHTKLVSLNAQSSEAIVLAQDKLEDLWTMNFTNLASNSTPLVTKTGSRTQRAGQYSKTPLPDMATLTITVAWNHKGVVKNSVTKSNFSRVVPS